MHEIVEVVISVLFLIYHICESLVLCFIPRHLRYKDVEGELVLITGGGSGIGQLMAVEFAKRKCKLVIWDINTEGSEHTVKLVKAAGSQAWAYRVDVTNRQEVYEVAKQVKKEVGVVNILINNAGIVSGNMFMDIPDEKIIKTFDVNIMSHFWTMKAFLPDMKKINHGHVVSIASVAGISGVNRLSDYCASKFADVGLHESMLLEMESEGLDGVKFTCICPYFINTGMFTGVQSGLLPILEPSYVVEEIMAAILTNAEIKIMPRTLGFLLAVKGMIPVKAATKVLKAFKQTNAMDHFTGRK